MRRNKVINGKKRSTISSQVSFQKSSILKEEKLYKSSLQSSWRNDFSKPLVDLKGKENKTLQNKDKNILQTKLKDTNTTSTSTEELICRICQCSDDSISNQLVSACACQGSSKYVHVECLKKWRQTRNAQGEDVLVCEICKQQYKLFLLGKEGSKVENKIMEMEEDLKDLTTTSVYLMQLMQNMRINR